MFEKNEKMVINYTVKICRFIDLLTLPFFVPVWSQVYI